MLLVFWLSISFGLLQAQALKKGGRIPEFPKENKAYNGIRFDQHALTILDFWSHNCSACIASFPKLNQLQELFGDAVQIVLVNDESADSTERMFALRTWIEKPKVRMISGDTLLHNLFNVVGKPFVVWIDSTSTVRYLTDGTAIQGENIKGFLSKNEVDLLEIRPITYVSSLFDPVHENNLLSYSYLARSQYRLKVGSGKRPDTRVRDITLSGYAIQDLFRYAYEEGGKNTFSHRWQIKLQCDDPNLYRKPEGGYNLQQWRLSHTYDYDLRVPTGMETAKYRLMREDLHRYFPLKSYIDTIPMSSYVLVKTDGKDRLKTGGGKPLHTFRKSSLSARDLVLEKDKRILRNEPYEKFSDAISRLVEYDLHRPFFDLTDYTGNVDVEFDRITFDFFTLEGLQEELRRYGLELKERIMPIKVLQLVEH